MIGQTANHDTYLSRLTDPDQRAMLRDLRQRIHHILPDLEEGISYGMPAFRCRGKVVAGYAAWRGHLSYYPFSGQTLDGLGDRLLGFRRTKSALHFSAAQPISDALLRLMLDRRMSEIDASLTR